MAKNENNIKQQLDKVLEIMKEQEKIEMLRNDRTNDFDNAFRYLMVNEGSYSDLEKDPGGRTIFGITERDYPEDFAKIYALYKQGKKDEALKLTKEFYRKNFWQYRYQLIHDTALAFKLFDLSVNIGKVKAIKLLQQILKYIYKQNINITGNFDIPTFYAVNTVIEKYGRDNLYNNYVRAAELYYKKLKLFWFFGKGWLNRLFRKREI